ncbi:MAG: amino acid permease [Acidobacteria bacterium]|nr:amino acid permease [Acidobacteriota bacterium]
MSNPTTRNASSSGNANTKINLATLFRRKSIEQIQADAAAGVSDGEVSAGGLKRALSVTDLTLLGIAAVIGAGIFSTIGNAAASGGPAVSMLFVFTAIACAFAVLCYAEFASMIPVAGSAYTYAYASFGELAAWIIGWSLLMEYAIGNIAVAISWSDYFTTLLTGYGINLPEYLTMDFLTASRGYEKVNALLQGGDNLDQVRAMDGMGSAVVAYLAWTKAPVIDGWHFVCDFPALLIVFIITVLVYIGIRESKTASNAMVALKLAVILLVIVLGAFYINPANWSPFAPNGVEGVLKGVSAVFFAYIGFDAISTTAEECKNPQRDLPRGMIYSLIVCTILYVLISLVLTGMVNYKNLAVGDPMAYVFGPEGANLSWIKGIVAISAVIAMATVLLVFQLGQPRIWMAMSRDGLLPKIFSSIHPRFKTPWFSTIVTGLVVAIPSLFMNLTEVTDLTSIGTLFAFILVCGGVLMLDKSDQKIERRFRIPYINSRYIIPGLFILIWLWFIFFNREALSSFFSLHDPSDPILGVWDVFKHKIPFLIYLILSFVVMVYCFTKQLSLIPVLGLLTCGYLMTELGWINWARFLIWLVTGLLLYFVYGSRHSKLARKA